MKRSWNMILILMLSVTSHGWGQIVKEFPIVSRPVNWIPSAVMLDGAAGVIVEGAVKHQYTVFDDTYGITVPGFVRMNGTSFGPVVMLPETAQYRQRPFDGRFDEIHTAVIPKVYDSMEVLWSTLHREWQDYSPHERFFWPMLSRIGTVSGAAFTNIGRQLYGLNPSVADRGDYEGPRIAYETVTPLDTFYYDRSDSSRFYCTKYRSSIYLVAPFTQSLVLRIPALVGSGFSPQVKYGGDGNIHLLWFDADSNTAPTVSVKYRKFDVFGPNGETVTLRTGFPNVRFSTMIGQKIQWDVDSAGTVGFSDGLRRILRYHPVKGFTFDSLASNQYIADVKFMPNGEVRVVSNEEGLSLSRYRQYYSSATNGPLFQKRRELGDVPLNDQSRLITDRRGHSHLLRSGEPAILMNVSEGNSLVSHRFTGYSQLTNAVIDSVQQLWFAAKRDSVPVLLRTNVDSLAVRRFHFPMVIGDEWQFIGIQGMSIADWTLERLKVVKDTVAGNGKQYTLFSNRMMLRKEGLKVYSYSSSDSAEYVQYDFNAAAGDTIAKMNRAQFPRSVVLKSISDGPFGRTYRFEGNVHFMDKTMLITDVTDSIGFTGKQCALCEVEYQFQGARVNGTTIGSVVSVRSEVPETPAEFLLAQNYPNPFNPSTIIAYAVPQRSVVSLKIYDAIGREIETLVQTMQEPGRYSVRWNGNAMRSGAYFYRLSVGASTQTKRMMLIK